jgi:hypothetical protein
MGAAYISGISGHTKGEKFGMMSLVFGRNVYGQRGCHLCVYSQQLSSDSIQLTESTYTGSRTSVGPNPLVLYYYPQPNQVQSLVPFRATNSSKVLFFLS